MATRKTPGKATSPAKSDPNAFKGSPQKTENKAR